MAEYHREWDDRQVETVRLGKDDSRQSLDALAQRMLVAFASSSVAKPVGRILAIEEELRGPVIAGMPDILGRVDLIVETPDILVICDWKTSRARWSAHQIEDAAEQLLLYAELARDFAPWQAFAAGIGRLNQDQGSGRRTAFSVSRPEANRSD